MQRAFIVRYRYRDETRDHAVAEINELLASGWRVASMAPMGTAALRQSSQRELLAVFAALVVLEKDD